MPVSRLPWHPARRDARRTRTRRQAQNGPVSPPRSGKPHPPCPRRNAPPRWRHRQLEPQRRELVVSFGPGARPSCRLRRLVRTLLARLVVRSRQLLAADACRARSEGNARPGCTGGELACLVSVGPGSRFQRTGAAFGGGLRPGQAGPRRAGLGLAIELPDALARFRHESGGDACPGGPFDPQGRASRADLPPDLAVVSRPLPAVRMGQADSLVVR